MRARVGEASAPDFSEREFYVREFRGRTLAIALPGAAAGEVAAVAGVARALCEAGARVVVLTREAGSVGKELGAEPVGALDPRLEAELWRRLGSGGCAVAALGPDAAFHALCGDVALRLRLFKEVWIDPGGGLGDGVGGRRSFVDLEGLRRLLGEGADLAGDEPRRGLFEHVRDALEAGVPAINVCTAEGLDAELFSYAGSGTLFTRERYVQVRRLGLDDFDAAHDLIRRGVAEGYLAERSPDEVDGILGSAFGAFVEETHLAGIGALLEGYEDAVGEIASLYTLTRFLGEGVGGHLVAFAVECARARGLGQVFACTTSERVGAFFERQGFERVALESLPPEKWAGYADERRARVRCYAITLAA